MRAAAVVVLGALWAMGCGIGNGDQESEAREVGEFTSLEATQAVLVRVRIGEPASVIIETDANLLPMVETVVRDGQLHIGIRDSQWAFASQGVRATVVTPTLASVEATSGAKVWVEEVVQPELTATSTSDARIELTGLKVDRLTASAESGSLLIAQGSAEVFDAHATATATLFAGDLAAQEVHLEATSWSRGTVSAASLISGSVDSGAVFLVRGSPPRNFLSVEAGGQVRYGE